MKPILFNTEMVQAVQEDRKTVTRRVVKPQPRGGICNPPKDPPGLEDLYGNDLHQPYRPGDILWVRETWWKNYGHKYGTYFYRADGEEIDIPLITGGTRKHGKADGLKWRPSIHMPREAARLFLWVKAVRVERLQDITEEQAEAEGAYRAYPYTEPGTGKTVYARDERATYRGGFSAIWNSTIKPAHLPFYGWEANPWVWVIEFERISKEAEQREEEQDD